MTISPYLQRLRQAVGHDTLLVPSASVVIRDNNGRILLQQRADNLEWVLPGGAMDPGESIAQTAIREVREETGLDIELVRLVGVYSDPTHSYTYVNGDQIQGVVLLFEGRVISGRLTPDCEETRKLAFFLPDAFPANLSEQQHVRIIDAIANRPEAFFR